MRYLVELSGESTGLATAEAMGASLSEGRASVIEADSRALVLEAEIAPARLASRLGLAWSVSEHKFSCTEPELESRLEGLSLPGRSFAVRAKRLNAAVGPGNSMALAARAGKVLSAKYDVDLKRPDVELRILLGSRCHVGVLHAEVDRSSFESRKPENRPFNHPISLHPRLARALVNLARAAPGASLLDPFCGTGGILIEAGIIGCRPLGGDIDSRMVEGSRQNLAHIGIEGAEVVEADISAWQAKPGSVHAIATDPPYGRSASTAKEPIRELYKRAFEASHACLRDGGRLAIVLPDKRHAALANGFDLEQVHPVRVHRSLTRYFCCLRKV